MFSGFRNNIAYLLQISINKTKTNIYEHKFFDQRKDTL
jgi:hypothetical protein